MIPLKQIETAVETIKDRITTTPLIHSPSLSRRFGGSIYVKMENLQRTGSFKIRGATYKLAVMAKNIQEGGVVAASAGNHAQGVALAANTIGVPATIVMPEWASISKQEATRSYGGNVVLYGKTIGESLQKAQELAEEQKTFVHPFDDNEIITGQGTIAIEILNQLPDTAMIILPIGGGGLISGIASGAKAINPQIKIIGVQASACPSARQALKENKPVRVHSQKSIADGINVRQVGETPFEIIKKLVDDVVVVAEDEIAAAVLMLLELKRIVAEGAGAVPLAAVMNGAVTVPSKGKTVLLISGGNVDSPLLGRILRQGLIRNGRILRFGVNLDDVPGSLSNLLSVIAGLKANVLHIYHDRHLRDLPIYKTRVELELETRSRSHADKIIQKLYQKGYELLSR